MTKDEELNSCWVFFFFFKKMEIWKKSNPYRDDDRAAAMGRVEIAEDDGSTLFK